MRPYFFSSSEEITQYMLAGLGKIQPTMVIKNAEVIDVYQGLTQKANVWIYKDRIVSVTNREAHAPITVDGAGLFMAPGLMDAHIHIESTMILPSELAKILIPHGVTSLFADPHEIANVFGIQGVRELNRLSKDSGVRVFTLVPSRVPTAPGLEDSACSFGLEEIRELLKTENSVALGELNYQNLFSDPSKFSSEILASDEIGKIANGHMAAMNPDELDGAIAAGLSDDHECLSQTEAIMKASKGLSIMVREGTTEKNLADILSGLKLKDYRSYTMCTDDRDPGEMVKDGHIDYNVRKAIEVGIDPIVALQMATINIAQHFHMARYLGAIAPTRKADFFLFKDLKKIDIKTVVFDGKLVFNNGTLTLASPQMTPAPEFLNSVKISPALTEKDLVITSKGDHCLVHVIVLIDGRVVKSRKTAQLDVLNGYVSADNSQGINLITVIERHRGLKSVGNGFVSGFGIENGAIASSISHDHHNIVAVGDNPYDLYTAAKHIEKINGGLVAVSKGNILADFPLEFGGLISIAPYQSVVEGLKRVNEAARKLGSPLTNPFVELVFVSLPSVPELGVSNRGMIDVRLGRVIDPVIETMKD